MYLPNGPQQNVPVASLTGWSQRFSDTYADDLMPQVPAIIAACTGNRIMRTSVFTSAGGAGSQGFSDGQVRWYFSSTYSWGFASPGDTLQLNTCDTGNDGAAAGADRLCWHTLGGVGGYRCGTSMVLNSDATWDRLIYQAN